MPTFHIYIPMKWFEDRLEWMKTQRQKNQYCKDMFQYTYTETIKAIVDMKSRWMTVIPSDSCDNRDKEWKCLWHSK